MYVVKIELRVFSSTLKLTVSLPLEKKAPKPNRNISSEATIHFSGATFVSGSVMIESLHLKKCVHFEKSFPASYVDN